MTEQSQGSTVPETPSPLGIEPGANVLVGRSRTTEPGGSLIWTLDVSDQLVEAVGEDWSERVQFRFERCEDGALAMWVRSA